MVFIGSIYARREEFIGNKHNIYHTHNPVKLNAVSQYEAIGKALKIAHKLFPETEGWHSHDVKVVEDILTIDDPDTVVWTKTEEKK